MAGHSKWKNIQHRKGAQDARRGKIFTKLAKEIAVAAKLGGEDPDTNARLRTAILKARASSMPKDNIERAVKKGMGGDDGSTYSEKVYEGYGPGGVAIMVECLTDNVNRTIAEIRHIFSRNGGNIGTEGSVSWMFQKKGTIVYQTNKVSDFDKMFEVALENGAEEVNEEDGVYEVLCAPGDFNRLKEALDKLNIEADVAEISQIAENYSLIDKDKAQTLTKLIDLLEDNDDVQSVHHNAEMPD